MLLWPLCGYGQLSFLTPGNAQDCLLDAAQPTAAFVVNPPNTGLYMTSHGPLKVLIIMAEFSDDRWEESNTQWPSSFLANGDRRTDVTTTDGNSHPIWANDPRRFVVPVNTFPNFPTVVGAADDQLREFSLSHYFYEMSKNSTEPLQIYGTVVHHIYARTRQ